MIIMIGRCLPMTNAFLLDTSTCIYNDMINNAHVVDDTFMKYLDKVKKVQSICDLSKLKTRSNDNRVYIYIHRKQFIASNKKELIEKIYDFYFSFNSYTLKETYLEWLKNRIANKVVGKTIIEDRNVWIRFCENHSISNMELRDIKVKHLENFYYDVTSNKDTTIKAFSNLKSLLNKIFAYGVSLEIIPHVITKEVDTKIFSSRCKPTQKKTCYTQEERTKVKEYLKDKYDTPSLAIRFAFDTYLRISELGGIRLDDIQGDEVLIHFSNRRLQELSEDLKSISSTYLVEEKLKSKDYGEKRKIPLTKEQMEIANYIKEHYPTNEFLFMYKGKPINGDVFNRELKKVCETLNIPYRSSHQIRFTNATRLHQNGMSIYEISGLLGHSTIATTINYIRQDTISKETKDRARQILA